MANIVDSPEHWHLWATVPAAGFAGVATSCCITHPSVFIRIFRYRISSLKNRVSWPHIMATQLSKGLSCQLTWYPTLPSYPLHLDFGDFETDSCATQFPTKKCPSNNARPWGGHVRMHSALLILHNLALQSEEAVKIYLASAAGFTREPWRLTRLGWEGRPLARN